MNEVERPASETVWGEQADTYDLEFDHWTDHDLPFYLEETKVDGPVLELACGTGRLTIPLADAGIQIVGVDASTSMLAQARRKSGGRAYPQWVLGRMESFKLNEKFALVMIPLCSFFDLQTLEAQEATLRNIRAHLRGGGRIILDIAAPGSDLFGAPLEPDLKNQKEFLLKTDLGSTSYTRVRESAFHLPQEQVFEIRREVVELDSDMRKAGKKNVQLIPGRYLHRSEMELLFRLCGFEVVHVYGGYRREPFDESSGRMVWVAQVAAS